MMFLNPRTSKYGSGQ